MSIKAIEESDQTFNSKISSFSCPRCLLKSADLSDMEKAKNANLVEFEYSVMMLSPLHARIRFMEYIINSMALKNSPDKSRVSKKDGSAQRKDEFKRNICQKIREKFGILLFQPIPGGSGNTNSGNTSRRFFNEAGKFFCEEFQFNEELFFEIRDLLNMLNSNTKASKTQFEALSEKIAKGLVEQYPNINFTPSVHKVLFHTAELVEAFPLALGMYSEEAQEGFHKILRKSRETHTAKKSRKNTMKTLMLHLTRISDPKITNEYV